MEIGPWSPSRASRPREPECLLQRELSCAWIISSWFRSCASLHDDLAEHALFIVSGDKAGELKFAALSKPPNEFAVPVRHEPLRVRVVMLHVRMLLHDFGMLAIFGNGCEYEFVILLAAVLQNKTDLLPPSHLDSRRLETHLAASLEHLDLDDARWLLGITRLAGREASVILMGGRRNGHCDIRRQDCGARRQANGGDAARLFQPAEGTPSVSLVVISKSYHP